MAILKFKQKAGHAAGIFADMTLDGPEIGTLVAIVDRAKNLPNRKTMGKQDPYCAMRLAKEARKTQTDRRGGQTPRWDEELRFIVHDSPDYYKLKCSIFNDDKKTDLIGEAWVDLTDVVKPGGGQSDLWQQLNFKGKYAGDVRMELTFYDSREQPVDKRKDLPRGRKDSTPIDSMNGYDSSTSGHRQLGPRDIRRRPLPQSPSEQGPEHTDLNAAEQQQPTLPHLPPQIPIDDDHAQPASPHDQPRDDDDAWLDTPYDNPIYPPHPSSQERPQPWQYPLGKTFRDYPIDAESYSHNRRSLTEQARPLPPPQSSTHYQADTHTHSEPTTPYSAPTYSSRPTPAETHSESYIPPRHSQYLDRQNVSPTKALQQPVFQDSPLRQSQNDQDLFSAASPRSDAPPPLPPKHRDTAPRRSRTDYPPSAYAPQPLRVTPQRHSISDRSPLQSIEDNLDPRTDQLYTDRPHMVRRSSYDLPPNDTPFDRQIDPYRSQPYPLPARQPMQRPQSSSRRSSYEIRHPSLGEQIMDESEQIPPHPDYRQPRQHHPVPSMMRDPSPGLQPAIARKAVGDQPKRLSNVPFGPDSYDVLNPSSSPAATNDARTNGAEKTKDQAPIIGNDGRVIDPSDHLPFDTWAPEPDRKVKKPEHIITIRSKNDRQTPAGARSSPLIIRHGGSATSTPQRPTPIMASSPVSIQAPSPVTPSGRNRLRKPAHARPLPTQPDSPAQPQLYTPSPAAASSPALVSSPADRYAQHRNSYHRQSSTDGRPSSIVRPPLSEYQVPVGNNYSPRGPAAAYAENTRQNTAPYKPSPRGYPSQARPINDQRHSYYGGGSHENESPATGYDDYRGREDWHNASHYDNGLAAEMSKIDLGPSRGYDRLPPRASRGYGY